MALTLNDYINILQGGTELIFGKETFWDSCNLVGLNSSAPTIYFGSKNRNRAAILSNFSSKYVDDPKSR